MFSRLSFLFLFLGWTTLLRAGHESGGLIITYKSLQAVTGVALEYEITAYTLYDTQGPSVPANMSISVSSSCFTNSTVALSRNNPGGSLTPLSGLDYCTTNIASLNTLSLAIFKGTVTLPGTCADFRFFTSGGFGRYNNTVNLSNSFNTAYFYADLDNTLGPNSSPEVPTSDLLQVVCRNKALNLYNFTESEGDSVYYSASSPAYISGSTVGNFGYNSGYSQSNPVGSSSGFTLNPQTGIVQTQINSSGAYAVTIQFEEFRPDVTGSPVKISEGRYVMTLVGAASCSAPSFDMIYAPVAIPDTVDCGTSTIRLAGSRRISTSSVSPDGSEFQVQSTVHGTMAVAAAQVVQDSLIELTLSGTIAGGDVLKVYTQNGSDGDGVISVCGQEWVNGADTLHYYSPVVPVIPPGFTPTQSGLTVNFAASVTLNQADSIHWDFGDGATAANTLNPSHTYGMAGSYTVVLSSYNRCGDSLSKSIPILVCDSLGINFTYTISGTSITATATGTTGALLYTWDMGDGIVQLGSAPTFTHTYTSEGTYTVMFIATNLCGEADTLIQTIDICAPLTADFNAQASGQSVTFDASVSLGNATDYYWSLGDGTTATGANYIHAYSAVGSYVVTLIIVNACGDSATISKTIDLCQSPVSSWTYQILSSGGNGLEIQFDGTASQHATAYSWNFGDGNTANTAAPLHTYATVSLSYLVSLTVTNACNEQSTYAYRLDQVSLPEFDPAKKIDIYPNPVQEVLHLEWDPALTRPESIQLYNTAGVLVKVYDLTLPMLEEGQIHWPVYDLPPGMYVVRMTGTNLEIQQPVSVQ